MAERPLEDWEDPEPDDDDEEETEEYVCPSCGASVYEDCEQCPHCGDYITPRSATVSPLQGRWIAIVAIVLVTLMLLGFFYAY
jgi:hypothetical protein